MKRTLQLSRAAFILYCLAILALSVLNIRGAGSLSETRLAGFRSDYLLHVLIFAPFMLLARWGWKGAARKNTRFWVAAGLALAVVSECVQWFLPHRTFNQFDLLANGGGIVLGAIIAWLAWVVDEKYGKRQGARGAGQ